ncbi:MAG: homocysteine S-methyltransferase family protein [Christensenellales bacterium]|jgi:5-methyltetrahydrofolate--homocysteine methyltransferase
MKHEIIMMDGAVGTSLWEKADHQVPVWRYNVENPVIVRELHQEMADAGAQMVLTNTFGANAGSLVKSPYTVPDIITRGVRLCRETVGSRAQVALAVGPLVGLMEPYGDITEEEAEAQYMEVLKAGAAEKPDVIYLMTFIDLDMLKIAAKCARRFDLPLFCSMSFEKVGKTIMGNSVEDMATGLAPWQPDAIGLNCSMGPDLAMPVLRQFRSCTDLPLIFKPNAGRTTLVDGKSVTELDPDVFVYDMLPAVEAGATYIGGCCGTSPGYLKKLVQAIRNI